MLPSFSVNNTPNIRFHNSERFASLCKGYVAICVGLSYFSNHIISEFRKTVFDAVKPFFWMGKFSISRTRGHPSFVYGISDIIFLRANPKMFWIHARTVVWPWTAIVKHLQSIRNCASVYKPRCTMSGNPMSKPCSPVAVRSQIAFPNPAPVRRRYFINLFPESFLKRFFTLEISIVPIRECWNTFFRFVHNSLYVSDLVSACSATTDTRYDFVGTA